jgi:hypothetical protein
VRPQRSSLPPAPPPPSAPPTSSPWRQRPACASCVPRAPSQASQQASRRRSCRLRRCAQASWHGDRLLPLTAHCQRQVQRPRRRPRPSSWLRARPPLLQTQRLAAAPASSASCCSGQRPLPALGPTRQPLSLQALLLPPLLQPQLLLAAQPRPASVVLRCSIEVGALQLQPCSWPLRERAWAAPPRPWRRAGRDRRDPAGRSPTSRNRDICWWARVRSGARTCISHPRRGERRSRSGARHGTCRLAGAEVGPVHHAVRRPWS